jgi:hypothetical protein
MPELDGTITLWYYVESFGVESSGDDLIGREHR